MEDAVRDFDHPQLTEEATAQPSANDRVGGLAWKAVTIPPDDPKTPLGDIDLHWLDFLPTIGPFKKNQIAYAHTYLYSPRGGPARAVVDHACGLKAWLNGKEIYRRPEFHVILGNYPSISRHELAQSIDASPHFDLDLRPGWNRLLLKVCSDPRTGGSETRLALRLIEAAGVAYDTANIAWMTELPARSNATIIRAGERLFVLAEPDELLCLDRATGRVLWSAFNNYYEALSPEERQANPAYRERIDPLVAQLRREKDLRRRRQLRAKLQETLKAIDPARFEVKLDGHFHDHFGIVGYTSTTPVSDGKHVWAWFGSGVAACYDLDGHRRWITRLPSDELSYSSSPVLSAGVLAVFHGRLQGLDAQTGAVRGSSAGSTRTAVLCSPSTWPVSRSSLLSPVPSSALRTATCFTGPRVKPPGPPAGRPLSCWGTVCTYPGMAFVLSASSISAARRETTGSRRFWLLSIWICPGRCITTGKATGSIGRPRGRRSSMTVWLTFSTCTASSTSWTWKPGV